MNTPRLTPKEVFVLFKKGVSEAQFEKIVELGKSAIQKGMQGRMMVIVDSVFNANEVEVGVRKKAFNATYYFQESEGGYSDDNSTSKHLSTSAPLIKREDINRTDNTTPLSIFVYTNLGNCRFDIAV